MIANMQNIIALSHAQQDDGGVANRRGAMQNHVDGSVTRAVFVIGLRLDEKQNCGANAS